MKTIVEIQQMLDEKVNTLLGQHGGRVEIIRLDREPKDMEVHIYTAYVQMVGGCRGCAGAKATLKTIITGHIKDFDITIDDVVDTTDHSDKSQAFLKE